MISDIYWAYKNSKYLKAQSAVVFAAMNEISSPMSKPMWSAAPIPLDNKCQKYFCICDEYVINLFVCIYEVRKGT